MTSVFLTAALDYATRMLPVFPCAPRGKEPAVARGFHSATTNPETIKRLWRQADRNIGIPTGSVSGFWVLDVDGEDGEASLRALEAKHGPLPATREVITGSGRHFWFKYTRPDSIHRRSDRARSRYQRRRRLCDRAAAHPSGGRAITGRLIRTINSPTRRIGWSGSPARKPQSISERALAQLRPAIGWRTATRMPTDRPRSMPRSKRSPPRCPARATTRSTARLQTVSARRRRRTRRPGHRAPDRGLPPQRPGQRRRAAFRRGDNSERARRLEAPTLAIGCRMSELRPYQIEIIARIRSYARTASAASSWWRRPAAAKRSSPPPIIKAEVERYKNVLVLAHRREIIAQTSEKLHAHGIAHGIIQAGLSAASARARAGGRDPDAASARHPAAMPCDLPPADLLIVDEATTRPAQTYQKIIDGLSGCDAARPDGHAMPRRRARARRHFRRQ